MKTILKLCTFVIIATILSFGLISANIQTPDKTAYAQIVCTTDADCPRELDVCINNKCVDILTGEIVCTIDADCPRELDVCINNKCVGILTGEVVGDITKAAEITRGLPEITLEQAIATTIQTILGWAMLITIIAIVVAAIYYLKSQGRDEDLTKAKSIIVYLIVGMAIMAAAYGVVTGIAQFDFFRGDT